MYNEKYNHRIYAGVLGKIIGVYLGRPVEGWSYDHILEQLGDVWFYVNEATGHPLIVPDDDISGTFAFFRALEDNGYPADISSETIGRTWLNYIIENQTILWWGGLSRSTEHTAFLRLKNGIEAPRSGSSELNGESMATQIGAQIFIDAWAMANPANPERAAAMAREAARVSHDGIAVEAAVYLAVMESMAFEEKRLGVLLDEGLRYIRDRRLTELIGDIRQVCAGASHWRAVRDYIAEHHGYDKYPGNCPMVTNHLTVLMALIMGGEDFQKSLHIAASAAWDTDCNAGNAGCLNGIRLGLEGIGRGADFRTPVSDRLLVVSSDGGRCISDAVIESRRIIRAAAALDRLPVPVPQKRFSFEFPGSTQGFKLSDDLLLGQGVTSLENAQERFNRSGLLIRYKGLASGTMGRICTATYPDPEPLGQEGTSYFDVSASPTLYSTQTVEAVMEGLEETNPDIRFFIQWIKDDGGLAKACSPGFRLVQGENRLSWEVPETRGFPICRIGIELRSEIPLEGAVRLVSLDWSRAPRKFRMPRSYEMSPSLTPWTTATPWLKSFMSSARNFAPDYTTTFSLSHPGENGIVTIGTTDWKDYSLSSVLQFQQHGGAGLVVRSRGHRRYYAALIQGLFARILKVKDRETFLLAEKDCGFQIDRQHALEFGAMDSRLTMSVDGQWVITAEDDEYRCGAAGFVVHQGAVLIDTFTVSAQPEQAL